MLTSIANNRIRRGAVPAMILAALARVTLPSTAPEPAAYRAARLAGTR